MLEVKMSAAGLIFLGCCFIGFVQCEEARARLEILPIGSEVRTHPVGKFLMLTCRAEVTEINLVTDLQWRDNVNMSVLPKPPGQDLPAMYTELLPVDKGLALMIPKLIEAMAGRYTCSASYSNEMLETSVKLETYVPITWKDAPKNQYPILGSDYTVKCEVTSNPAPAVRWQRNGDNIETGGRYVVQTHGLLILNVQESDDGFYVCRASVTETGELVERPIRVEVYIRPEITFLPAKLEAIEGQQFSTFCNASGKPVPEYIWVKDLTQQNVATADRFLVNPQTGLLTITRVEQEDYGNYTCQAKNDAGIASAKTLLDVLVKPKIIELYNLTVAESKEGTITCRAKGRPAPNVTFRRWGSEEEFVLGQQPDDDRIYLDQYSDNVKGESTGKLTISKALRTDDGLYQCVARNRGDTAYHTGHITVEYPPSFEQMRDLPPVFSWEERPANLSCLAMSIPNATIEWRWNGRLIPELLDKHLEIVGTGPRSDLIVKPVARNYYSVYKCIAKNIRGQAEIDMELREGTRPDVIVSATPEVVTATTVTFNIIGPATERGLPIIAYTCQYKEALNPDWSKAYERTWSPDSPYIIEGLKPQTTYEFRFAARNHVDLGSWSPPKIQSTPRRSAPEEPKTLHKPEQEDDNESIVISPYSDHFELRWSVPNNNGEPIDFYQAKYCQGYKVNGEWNELANECISRDVLDATNYEMTNLLGNTYYRIELRAHNAIGFSSPAGFIMKTARGSDLVVRADKQVLSSAAIVGIAVGGVLLLLLIVDLLCCVTLRMGLFASMCRKTKRSPSEIDEETKLGSLYGWRFPLPYCSGQLVKEPPPSPLPLPPPVKLGGSPMASPLDEKQPLNNQTDDIRVNSTVDFDGRFVHSRSGDIIGKNSAV